ncbi:MAG TPA: glycoside hydrolase family 15 protein [Myxococcales bacterium]|nr:glycoside hydrolase family 15 protein [Myxococcales bacterium]
MTTKEPRIHDYAVVGDGRSAALISRTGSLDWLCWPRFDSPSLFGAILDPRAGRFSIAPAGPSRSERWYAPGTNVLCTRFSAAQGEILLTDFMPASDESERRRRMQPENELVRVVECTRGEVELAICFEPRPDYGRERCALVDAGKLGLRMECRRGLLALRSETRLTISDGGARGRVRIRAGERLDFSLTLATHDIAVLPPLGDFYRSALDRTLRYWREWSSRTEYDGPYREQVVRSALVLKLLGFAPSGAIVAAPTTSLPERPGGDLNWDYRFCWLRDASLTARALFGLGHADEAEAFVDWLLNATSRSWPQLQVLYDVYGRNPPAERELPHLAGHGGARPVRVGNAAARQFQLDLYGEVVGAATFLVRSGETLDRGTQKELIGLGRLVCERWLDPDQGIWEVRDERRHFTHSRVLCWAALDGLLELHARNHLRAPVDLFARNRALIHEEVEALGYSQQLQSYTRTLSGSDVDASLLLLPWYGYTEAAGRRMRSTFVRIRQELYAGDGLYRRYHGRWTEGEGAFGICSFWAAEYLAMGGGSREEAEAELEALLQHANDVGLYAEEILPETGEALGNFPQAYTHVGLINAALTLRDRTLGREANGRETPHAAAEARE